MPNRFKPIHPGSDQRNIVAQINSNFADLDRESVVKQFKGNTGETLTIGKTGDDTLGINVMQGTNQAMQFGKYNADRYGFLLYDDDGIPSILIGQAPDDGRMGIWVAAPGENVLTLLGA